MRFQSERERRKASSETSKDSCCDQNMPGLCIELGRISTIRHKGGSASSVIVVIDRGGNPLTCYISNSIMEAPTGL